MNAPITLKVHRFLLANDQFPVVYASVEAHSCTYRLSDGSTWRMSIRESREVGFPNFAHLEAIGKPCRRTAQHREEELALLKRLRAEAMLPSPLA